MSLPRLVLGLAVTVLLGVAGTTTAARLLEPRGGPWVRLVAFTPYALPLYGLAALLLLLVWWRGRGFWRGTARARCG